MLEEKLNTLRSSVVLISLVVSLEIILLIDLLIVASISFKDNVSLQTFALKMALTILL